MMHVLLPVDGSALSQETVRWVCDMMNPTTTRFSLLTVIPEVLAELPVDAVQVDDALAILNVYENMIDNAGYEVVHADYMIGNPVESICRYADEHQVDQIFMGSHGRSALGRFVFGSVSSGVFKHANRPVFVHRNMEAKTLSSAMG